MVAGDLGQEFVRGNTDGGSELPFGKNPLLQLPRHWQRLQQRTLRILSSTEAGHLQVSFVNRHAFYHGSGVSHELHNHCGFLLIRFHPRSDENAFRTEAPSGRGWPPGTRAHLWSPGAADGPRACGHPNRPQQSPAAGATRANEFLKQGVSARFNAFP